MESDNTCPGPPPTQCLRCCCPSEEVDGVSKPPKSLSPLLCILASLPLRSMFRFGPSSHLLPRPQSRTTATNPPRSRAFGEFLTSGVVILPPPGKRRTTFRDTPSG